MKSLFFVRSSLGLLAAMSLAIAAFGQANLASVTGVITDPTDAGIPLVNVTIRNVDTNMDRRVLTDESGGYTLTSLPPGNYELAADRTGFRRFVQRGILLQTGQVFRSDLRMEIGDVTESVTVDAHIVTINTENGTIKGDVIVHEEIQELPLAGRDFTDLAFFVPGVVPTPTGGFGSEMVVNGARATNTNFYIDGFDNRNSRAGNAAARPNIDALQEFKMEVSGYSAEYGRMAGGIVNMALRSGTNQFHGNINYFLRNNIFDARGFFDEDKTILRQHQFAVTVAGPVLRNKTFFMASFEGLRTKQELTSLVRVPTLLERGGDYSRSVNISGGPLFLFDRLATGACSAANRAACFPGNIIPRSRMEPIGLRILSYFPNPNRTVETTGFNYSTVGANSSNWSSPLLKIDHRISKGVLAVRYQTRNTDATNPFTGSELGTFGIFSDDKRSFGGVDYTHTVSPSLLAEVRIGFSRSATAQRGRFAGTDIASQLGLPNLISEGQSRNDPTLLDWPQINAGGNYPQLGSGVNMPLQIYVTDYQSGFKFTWVKNSHNLRWGFNGNLVQFNQPFPNNQRGTFAFAGNRTGHSIADMQLGWLNTATRQVGFNRNYFRQRAMGAFINDDWKATRKLTLNLGLRWEVNEAPYDKYDHLATYDTASRKLILADDADAPANYPELLDRTGLRGLVTTAAEVGRGRSVISTDWINFSPRVGLAYRLTPQTVVRGGYGIFLSGDMLNSLRVSLGNQFPFSINQSFVGVNTNPNQVSLQTPFPADRATITGTTTVSGFTLDPKQSYLQSWNVTVERELFGSTVVELDYRGSKGTFLQRQYDFNQPFRNLSAAQSGEGFARPIPVWNAINMYATGSNSIYNAFNISWRRRSRGCLFWRANYSLAKSIDDASQVNGASAGGFNGALDARNLRLERARSDWDRRHVFTAVGSFNLPFGKGLRWGSNWSKPVEGVLGGWQLSGTTTAYSGAPFTVKTATPNLEQGGSARPNRLREGSISNDPSRGKKGVDYTWYDLSAFEGVPCYIAPGAAVPAGCQASKFGFAPFAFGNSGRNILDGPGFFSADLALAKNFKIREGHNLQLRIESFNVFNRTNFIISNPMTQFDSLTGGLLNDVGSVGRGGGPRIFQYAIKYRF